jgi:hypothetical protein
MQQFTVSLAVVVVLLVGGIATLGWSTTAQEATPAAMSTADHPVVGAWRWNNAPEDLLPYTYAIFHDDGTYHEVAGGATGIGVWQATGERTAEIGYLFQDLDPTSGAFEPGTVILRAAVEVNAAGDAATVTYSAEAQAPDGTLVFQADGLEGTLTRITLDSLAFPGTPVAATPTS